MKNSFRRGTASACKIMGSVGRGVHNVPLEAEVSRRNKKALTCAHAHIRTRETPAVPPYLICRFRHTRSNENANTFPAFNAGTRLGYSSPFASPSAVHLPSGISAGLSPPPALCGRLPRLDLRIIGLLCELVRHYTPLFSVCQPLFFDPAKKTARPRKIPPPLDFAGGVCYNSRKNGGHGAGLHAPRRLAGNRSKSTKRTRFPARGKARRKHRRSSRSERPTRRNSLRLRAAEPLSFVLRRLAGNRSKSTKRSQFMARDKAHRKRRRSSRSKRPARRNSLRLRGGRAAFVCSTPARGKRKQIHQTQSVYGTGQSPPKAPAKFAERTTGATKQPSAARRQSRFRLFYAGSRETEANPPNVVSLWRGAKPAESTGEVRGANDQRDESAFGRARA